MAPDLRSVAPPSRQIAWKEMAAMVRKMGKGLTLDLRPAIESMGLGQVIERIGTKRSSKRLA
jgi:hypothetical protein